VWIRLEVESSRHDDPGPLPGWIGTLNREHHTTFRWSAAPRRLSPQPVRSSSATESGRANPTGVSCACPAGVSGDQLGELPENQ